MIKAKKELKCPICTVSLFATGVKEQVQVIGTGYIVWKKTPTTKGLLRQGQYITVDVEGTDITEGKEWYCNTCGCELDYAYIQPILTAPDNNIKR